MMYKAGFNYVHFRIPLLEQIKMTWSLPTKIIHSRRVSPIWLTLLITLLMTLVIYQQPIWMRIVCPLKSLLFAPSYKVLKYILIVTDWVSSEFLFVCLSLVRPRVIWAGMRPARVRVFIFSCFLQFPPDNTAGHQTGPGPNLSFTRGLAASSSARITINIRRFILTPALSHFFNGSWKFKPRCTEGQRTHAIIQN